MRNVSIREGDVFLLAFLLPPPANGQECSAIDSASVQKAEDYIRRAPDEAEVADCVRIAFHRIASFPPNVAVPTLIKYLAYKRPLNEGERSGIVMHGPVPSELYPAIGELASFVSTDQAKFVGTQLVSFIGYDQNATGVALQNALITLSVIYQADYPLIIRELHRESTKAQSAETSDRFQAAARMLSGWCPNESKSKCIDALEQ